ncbi:MAG: TolC family protein [Nitrospirota bacterium]
MHARVVLIVGSVAGIMGFGVPAWAQPSAEGALTLARAVERALETFPSVRAARAGLDEAHASVGEASAARLPSLQLNATATRFEEPMLVSPIHSFTPAGIPSFDHTLYQGSLALNYTVFDGGARGARIRLARAQAGSAESALGAEGQALVARVVSAYLEVLSQREVVAARDSHLVALGSELTRAQQRHEAGTAARVEVLRVQAALATAEAERVTTTEALNRAERELARLINRSVEEVRIAGLVPVVLSDPLLPSRDALTTEAREANPTAKQARALAASAGEAVAVAKSARWPELGLVGTYLYYDSGNHGADRTAEWNTGAKLSYVLFSGGARERGITRAQAALLSAEEQVRMAETQIDQEVDRAASRLDEARARIKSLETAVARYEEVVRVEKLLRETGSGTETDYLNAEADLLTARANLAEARYGEIAARTDLARVVGQLDLAWLRRTIGDQP